MYPTKSLQDLFRKFGAMIRRKQEIRVAETGIEEKEFDIRYSPIFKQARLACIAAMRRSRNTPGVCCKRKKVDEISFGTEVALLSDVEHQITDGKGLQKRFLYYVISRFGIRGQEELAELVITDFNVEKSDGQDVLVYSERLSKNNDVSMSKYQEESFRLPVKCYEEDVIRTFQQLFRHLPKKYETKNGKQYAFMQNIIRPRSNVWYNCKHRVSGRKLTGWMKCMAELVGAEGNFSGKSGRTTLVSRMCRSGVPISVGMDVTGHKTTEAFLRYNKNKEIESKCALDIVANPFDENGNRRLFPEVYKEELRAQDERQNAGIAMPKSLGAPKYFPLSAPSSGSGAATNTSYISDSSVPNTSVSSALTSVRNTCAPIVHSKVMVQDVESMNDDGQLNEDLEALARVDPVVRRAFNLETAQRNIMGGMFHNCVIHF